MRLEAHDLACDRGGRRVLDGVAFRLEPGDVLLVTGPNGSGKSTLLRLVAGLLRPARGRVSFDPAPEGAPPVHYLGHRDAVKPALTAAETLAFAAGMLGGTDGGEQRCLDALGIGHLADLPAAYLSAGQRRRLALARLVAAHRPVWLLDEPTAALDAEGERRLLGLIGEHRAAGGVVLAATHAPLPLPGARALRLGTVA